MFHELLQLFAVAAPNVDHNRPRREIGLCIGQRVSLPGESISTGHTPIFRRGTRKARPPPMNLKQRVFRNSSRR